MPRTVTVGLDGSPESRVAADWAAREAKLRGLPLKLVNVWEPAPTPIAQAPCSARKPVSSGVNTYRVKRLGNCGRPTQRSRCSSSRSPGGRPRC